MRSSRGLTNLAYSMTLVLLLLSTVISMPTFLSSERTLRSGNGSNVQRRRYCGKRLVDALEYLCANNYASPSFKRSGLKAGQVIGAGDWTRDGDDSDERKGTSDDRYLIGPNQAYSLAKRGSADGVFFYRHVRGIADECCLNSCTEEDILQYCEVTKRADASESEANNNSLDNVLK